MIPSLGLPAPIRACLFDVDGVLTQTARVHAAAWKEMFDAYLRGRADRDDDPFRPFDPVRDYEVSVDGRPRADGIRTFLATRGIELPDGEPHDPPDTETVRELGNRKNQILLRMIHHDGVQAYEGSVAYLRAVQQAGLKRAAVSSSKNCEEVLRAAGIEQLLDERVDGRTAERDHLAGKPSPDMFLAAAGLLDVSIGEAAVFEDALAGVAAGRAGGFGYVVGVDRVGQAAELMAFGADLVVADLADLLDPA